MPECHISICAPKLRLRSIQRLRLVQISRPPHCHSLGADPRPWPQASPPQHSSAPPLRLSAGGLCLGIRAIHHGHRRARRFPRKSWPVRIILRSRLYRSTRLLRAGSRQLDIRLIPEIRSIRKLLVALPVRHWNRLHQHLHLPLRVQRAILETVSLIQVGKASSARGRPPAAPLPSHPAASSRRSTSQSEALPDQSPAPAVPSHPE